MDTFHSARYGIQREKWRKEEEERRVAKAFKDSKEELFQMISAWAEAKRIENFFESIENQADELEENVRNDVLKRLSLARRMFAVPSPADQFRKWKLPEER